MLRFLSSPIEIKGGERVESIVIGRNELIDDDGTLRARDTGEREELDCDLVLRSVGYTGIPIGGVPFDEKRGTILNEHGRVLEEHGGSHRTGHYTAGWIKRGPSGVIGTNKKDAQETVDHLLEDVAAGAEVLPQHLDPGLARGRAHGRVIVAHLGNGASMCGMKDLKSQASTMGFTAVDGLMMGTRSGAIDPGVLLYLMDNKGMGSAGLTRLLYKESGLLGVSGISQDMRTLLSSDKPEAQEAVDLFCYRIARELGSLAAAAGGLDAVVFTGGIGEHAAEVRRRVCIQSEWLGIRLNPEANARHDLHISAGNSSVDVLVIPTNEEWMMAHHAQTLLSL